MAWIFVDKEEEGGSKQQMRSQMRTMMRGGNYRHHDMGSGSDYREGYRQGYKHGWEDMEDEVGEDQEYRRRRDSRGRYM